MSEAPERIWAYAGAFKMWRDHKTDRPHTQTEYVRANRIEELEAKLAKAVEMLTLCRDMFAEVAHPSDPLSVMLNETLAELTGGKDE